MTASSHDVMHFTVLMGQVIWREMGGMKGWRLEYICTYCESTILPPANTFVLLVKAQFYPQRIHLYLLWKRNSTPSEKRRDCSELSITLYELTIVLRWQILWSTWHLTLWRLYVPLKRVVFFSVNNDVAFKQRADARKRRGNASNYSVRNVSNYSVQATREWMSGDSSCCWNASWILGFSWPLSRK